MHVCYIQDITDFSMVRGYIALWIHPSSYWDGITNEGISIGRSNCNWSPEMWRIEIAEYRLHFLSWKVRLDPVYETLFTHRHLNTKFEGLVCVIEDLSHVSLPLLYLAQLGGKELFDLALKPVSYSFYRQDVIRDHSDYVRLQPT